MANGNQVGIHDTGGGAGWCLYFNDKFATFYKTVTAPSFNAQSDYRIKINIQPLSNSKTIDHLKPIEYDLSGGKHDMGFLAHEVQKVLPFLVEGEKDGEAMQSINYNGFIALLVKEVQDLKKENRELMKMKAVQEQQTQIQQQQQSEIKSLQEDIKLLLLLRSEALI